MTKPKLSYFDAPVSRGEECRLALHVAGVDFEDVRIKREDWPLLKPTMPFGSVPVLEMAGHPPLAHSNAILVYVGRRWGLHPKDDFEAARHEALLSHVEDLRAAVAPSMRISDGDAKKKAREALLDFTLPSWAEAVDKQIADGPFFAGTTLHVVDLKLYMAVQWFARGAVDHIPATVFSAYPKLTRLHAAVAEEPRVRAWYARS